LDTVIGNERHHSFFDFCCIANEIISQAWDIDFAGSINNGMVDLNSIGGTLSDTGGLISSSIEANLGGVFTGTVGEAFVGDFDIIDEMNLLNQVNGLYTIAR